MSITATHIGVGLQRSPAEFTCTRCGINRKINSNRRNKDGEWVSPDRATYQCYECKLVLALEVEDDDATG